MSAKETEWDTVVEDSSSFRANIQGKLTGLGMVGVSKRHWGWGDWSRELEWEETTLNKRLREKNTN